MKEIDLLKELRDNTLESLIQRAGSLPGSDLNAVRLDIMQIKETLYDECFKLAERIFKEDMRR